MTVHTTTVKQQYTGNGSTRVWSYVFPCVDEDWLKLYVTEGGTTSRVLNDYTVDLDDKTVTYPVSGTPLSSSQTLTILREVPLEQSLDLVNQGTIEAEALEAEFDEIVQMLQQLDEQLKRCIMANVNENAPSVDYDDLTAAGRMAQTNGTAAGTAAQAANDAATLANSKAGAANTAAQNANSKADAANRAALAAQAVADAVLTYTTRAETAAQSAEADRITAYSNAQQAHRYFCAVWGVVYPFIRWFMTVPMVDGKCSMVFERRPTIGIYDGGDSTIFANTELDVRILDGGHSDPMDWVAINPLVTDFLQAVPRVRSLISQADAAQHALELTILAAKAAKAQAEAAIAAAQDWLAPMLQVMQGGANGQVLTKSGNSSEWLDLEKVIVDPTDQ